MRKNTAFTLVEVLVAVALTGMVLLTGYSAFQNIMEAQARLGATIAIQNNLFYTNEKLAGLIRSGGSIDYEEYFNRRMLGYEQEKRADGVFTFKYFSHFGNGSNTLGRTPLRYCGLSTWDDQEDCVDGSATVVSTSAASPSPGTNPFPVGIQQPYGQYAALAYNYNHFASGVYVGFPMPIQLPPIFKNDPLKTVNIFQRQAVAPDKVVAMQPSNVGLPELYLIKKNLDGTYERTHFRHVYADDPGTGGCTDPTADIAGCLGKIQMTKLISCDELLADGSVGKDGVIDAWIPSPDFAIGTVTCTNTANAANKIYKAAHEAALDAGTTPANLTWVDVTSPDMNVIRAHFLPSPLKIPTLMSGAGEKSSAPRVSLSLEVVLSTRLKNKSFVRDNRNFPRTLITTYDLSD